MRKIILISFFILSLLSCKNHKVQNKEIPVQTIIAKAENYCRQIESFGTINYKTKYEVTGFVNGTVRKKNFTDYSYVKKNQILYELDNLELLIKKSQYENDLLSAKAALNYTKTNYDDAKLSAKAKLLNIENQKLKLNQLKKEYELKSQELEKQKEIFNIGGITEQALIQMEYNLDELASNIEYLTKEIQSSTLGLTAQDLLNNGITPSENPEELQNQLIEFYCRSSKASIAVKEAEYDNAEKNLVLIEDFIERLKIKSPCDGVIVQSNFQAGEFVTENTTVAVIMDVKEYSAVFNIHENNIHDISIGQEISISFPSISDEIKSKIYEISPFADSSTGNFTIKANLTETENIKPGMFIKCTINSKSVNSNICIPGSSVLAKDSAHPYCYLILNNVAVKEDVEIEYESDGNCYLKTNSLENKQIIVNPSAQLKEGSNVKVL
ncbi:MAG: efflux RND transporter periplasmic adaptor subunit [Treponema sp.]|nr:efflux RND transporter periplasmic adaptor subunit [Treponema sp.]